MDTNSTTMCGEDDFCYILIKNVIITSHILLKHAYRPYSIYGIPNMYVCDVDVQQQICHNQMCHAFMDESYCTCQEGKFVQTKKSVYDRTCYIHWEHKHYYMCIVHPSMWISVWSTSEQATIAYMSKITDTFVTFRLFEAKFYIWKWYDYTL